MIIKDRTSNFVPEHFCKFLDIPISFCYVFTDKLYVVGGDSFPYMEVYEVEPAIRFVEELRMQKNFPRYPSSIVVGGTRCWYLVSHDHTVCLTNLPLYILGQKNNHIG